MAGRDEDSSSVTDDWEEISVIAPDADGLYPMPQKLAGYRVRAAGKPPAGDEAWVVMLLRPGSEDPILRHLISSRATLFWGARDGLDVVRGPTRMAVVGASVPVEVKARAI